MVGPEPHKWRSRWLFELRLSLPARDGKKKLTQAEFADELVAKGIELGKDPRIAYNRFEKGTNEPSDDLIASIAKAYDRAPPKAPPASPPADMATLIAANVRLTDQISALVEEMRLARERDQDAAAAMMRAAEVLLAAQRRAGDGGSTTPDAPLGSGK